MASRQMAIIPAEKYEYLSKQLELANAEKRNLKDEVLVLQLELAQSRVDRKEVAGLELEVARQREMCQEACEEREKLRLKLICLEDQKRELQGSKEGKEKVMTDVKHYLDVSIALLNSVPSGLEVVKELLGKYGIDDAPMSGQRKSKPSSTEDQHIPTTYAGQTYVTDTMTVPTMVEETDATNAPVAAGGGYSSEANDMPSRVLRDIAQNELAPPRQYANSVHQQMSPGLDENAFNRMVAISKRRYPTTVMKRKALGKKRKTSSKAVGLGQAIYTCDQ